MKSEPDNGYPSSAEEHVPESEWHRLLTHRLIDSLTHFYRSAERVCVSGCIDIYYERNIWYRSVRPDGFVARGAEVRRRKDYRVWEAGASPEFVIELVEPHTALGDQCTKMSLCQDRLRVTEFFLFDLKGGELPQRLLGYRLVEGVYQPILPVAGRLPSQVTRLQLEAVGD